MSGVALLIPLTATMTAGAQPEEAAASAIILLAGVYYGAMYGGSTTSILLNTPGESSSVVTTLDGYQLARQGRAGAALAIAAIGSFVAGVVSLVGLVFLARPLSDLALSFGPADYFSLMVLGLCAVSGLAGKSMTKALIMTVMGLLLSTIGMDNVSGVARFTYDIPVLYQGLEFLTVAVGLFAMGEVFRAILERERGESPVGRIGKVMPTRQELGQSAMPIMRGSLLGFLIGVLPGAGATLASFLPMFWRKSGANTPRSSGAERLRGWPHRSRLTTGHPAEP